MAARSGPSGKSPRKKASTPKEQSPAVSPRRVTVGLLVDPIYAHGRGIRRGIAAYGLEASWQFLKPTSWVFDINPDSRPWRVDGMIASVYNEKTRQTMENMDVPVVNISSLMPIGNYPSVICDNAAIGRLAAAHYLDRGIRNLAYVSEGSLTWSIERRDAFVEAVRSSGATCHVYPHRVFEELQGDDLRATSSAVLQAWLANLPKPTGVFAGNDTMAEMVMAAARDAGLRVPEELAILGVDNDELVVTMTTPALSSIDVNPERIGFEAARILDLMIHGEKPPEQPVRIPPLNVIARASSDVLALVDPDVTLAVRFIRDHASSPIGVDDVLAEVPLSRRPLEKRFRRVLGRSILDEIHRVRVDRASQLLVGTDMPMSAIAKGSGFTTYTRLGIVFRKLTGRSPSEHRKLFRPTRG